MKKILSVVFVVAFLAMGAAVIFLMNKSMNAPAPVVNVPAGVQSGMKIGIVDVDKILTDSPKFVKARAELMKKFEAKEKDMLKEQQALQKAAENFNKNGPTMKPDDQKKEHEKLIKMQKKLQDDQMKLQQEASVAQNQDITEIMKKVNGFAEENKFDLMHAKAGLLYSNKALDVTQEVIKLFK